MVWACLFTSAWKIPYTLHWVFDEVEERKVREEEGRPGRKDAQTNVTSLPSAVHRVVVLGATVEMVVPS